MPKPRFLRRQLLIDKQLQLNILGMSLFIAFVWILFSLVFYTAWTSLDPADDGTFHAKIIIAVVAVFIAIATLLMNLAVTNRIAGPIYRMRMELQRVCAGDQPNTLVIRDGDMLVDLYKDYNQLVTSNKNKWTTNSYEKN